MEKRDAYNVFSKKLEAMQLSRKINPDAVGIIGTIVDECKDREKFWVSNTEIPPQVAFTLYHASRNTRIIFEKMHNRFVHRLNKGSPGGRREEVEDLHGNALHLTFFF